MVVEAEQLMYSMTLGKGFIPTNSSVSFLLYLPASTLSGLGENNGPGVCHSSCLGPLSHSLTLHFKDSSCLLLSNSYVLLCLGHIFISTGILYWPLVAPLTLTSVLWNSSFWIYLTFELVLDVPYSPCEIIKVKNRRSWSFFLLSPIRHSPTENKAVISKCYWL